jgi:hypothetical protein
LSQWRLISLGSKFAEVFYHRDAEAQRLFTAEAQRFFWTKANAKKYSVLFVPLR